MQFLVHQQMNILSGAVIFLFGIYALSVLDKKVLINQTYIASLCLNLLLINAEIVLFILQEASIGLVWARILSALLKSLSPVLAYMFLKFICAYYMPPFEIKRSVRPVFKLLLVFNIFVGVLSSLLGKIQSESVLGYIIPFLASIIFLAYGLYVIIINKKILLKFEYGYILILSFITNVLVLSLLFSSRISFIWCITTFIIIMMFITIQQRELYRDALTGVRNRLVLKKCLDSHAKRPYEALSVIMIDMDYFKNINDSYGHLEGDRALKVFAKLLQKVYSESGIVIRMGGDEFIILVYGLSETKVNDLIIKMGKMVDRYNHRCEKPYMLKFSCACGTYKNDMSMDQFIHEIDLKMYNNKITRKRKLLNADIEF